MLQLPVYCFVENLSSPLSPKQLCSDEGCPGVCLLVNLTRVHLHISTLSMTSLVCLSHTSVVVVKGHQQIIKHFICGFTVHEHHGGEQGSRQTVTVLEWELRAAMMRHKREAEGEELLGWHRLLKSSKATPHPRSTSPPTRPWSPNSPTT